MKTQSGFTHVLGHYKSMIEHHLENYVQQLDDSRLSQACAYALLNGGKRFRPALVFLIAKALGKESQVVEAALAIEFFHTASLVADDLPCMDDDDNRRDKPSIHRAYDEATALLVSYALIAAGYELLAKNARRIPNGDHVCLLALENVAHNTGIKGATGGQYLDLFPPDLSEKTIRDLFHRKTGALFEIAFVLGWLYGNGDPQKLPHVKQAAAYFGMAFQIADDLGDEVDDKKNQRVNIIQVVGRDKALQTFYFEIQGYRDALNQLGVESSELNLLADVLVQGVRQITD